MTDAEATDRRRRALGLVARGAGLGVVGRVVRNGSQLVFAVLAARWLGPEAFGLWLLAFGIVAVAAQAVQLGLDRGAVAVIARARAARDDDVVRRGVAAALWTTLASGVVVAAVLIVAAGPLASRVLDQPDLLPYLHVMLFALPAHALLVVATGASRAFATMRPTVVAEETVQPLLFLALFVAAFSAGYPPVAAAWAQSASVSVAALLALAMLWRLLPARPAAAVVAAAAVWRPLLVASLPLALVAMSGRLYAWLSTLILGAWARPESVAVFQASLRVTFLLLFVTMPVNQMLAPVLAEAHDEGRRDDVASLLRTTTRWILAAGLPLTLTFCLFGADWLAVFGDGFRRGRPVLAALGVATLLNACMGPTFWLLQMARRERSALAVSALFVAVQAVLSFALAPTLGAFGAALATLGSVVVYAVAAGIVCRRSLGAHAFGRDALKPLAAATAAGAVGAALAIGLPAAAGWWSAPRLLVGAAAIAGTYLLVLARLGFEDDDRHVLARLRGRADQPLGGSTS